MKDDKKSALILLLKGKKPEAEEDHKEDSEVETDEEEKYEALGEDLLAAIKSENPAKVGRVLADIIKVLK